MVDQPASMLDEAENRLRLESVLVPRAVAWVTTTDGDGRWTAAPFDTVLPVPGGVPRLALLLPRGADGAVTTTERFLRERPELVVHGFDERIRDEALETVETPTEPHARDAAFGLQTVSSVAVSVPRLVDAWLAVECRVTSHEEIPGGGAGLVIAEVLHWHLHEGLGTDVMPNLHKLRPVGALGGHRYAPVREATRPLSPAHLRNP